MKLEFLRKSLSPELQEQVAIETNRCLDCGEQLSDQDGELVCKACGVVWHDGVELETGSIPFSESSQEDGHAESHFSPKVSLALGQGLGVNSLIDQSSMCRIIASGSGAPINVSCPKCGEPIGDNLGLRAKLVRILTAKTECHPWIDQVLIYGSKICAHYDLHRQSEVSIRFAEDYARLLRRLGSLFILQGQTFGELRSLSVGLFVSLHRQYFGANRTETPMRELGVDQKYLDYVDCLVACLKPQTRKVKLIS